MCLIHQKVILSSRNQESLEKLSEINIVHFSKKYKGLHLGRNNTGQQYMYSAGKKFHGKGLVGPNGHKFKCETAVMVVYSWMLSFGSRPRYVILPLWTALMRPYLKYCVQLQVPQDRKDTDMLEKFHCRAMNMIK